MQTDQAIRDELERFRDGLLHPIGMTDPLVHAQLTGVVEALTWVLGSGGAVPIPFLTRGEETP